MTIFGTSGNDNLTGTSGDDEFDVSQGGKDTVSGLEGDDTFLFGGELTEKDTIDGGLGLGDTVVLDGDYSLGLKFRSQTFTSVEILAFTAGHNYDITLVEDNFGPALMQAIIDGSTLGAADQLVFDGHKETTTHLHISAGAGDDTIVGGDHGNQIDLDAGGVDTARGGISADAFFMGGAFDDMDRLYGGDNTDQVTLVGDYSSGLTISKNMVHDIESLYLAGAFDYDITLKNNVVPAGSTFAVSTFGALGGFDVMVDASKDTDSTFNFYGGAPDETFVGGRGNDAFAYVAEGADHHQGRGGDDTFYARGGFGADDVVDGGAGYDTLVMFSHDLDTGIVLGPDTLQKVEAINFNYPYSYWLILDDGNVALDETLLVDGADIEATESLTFDGSAETDGAFFMIGGAGDDILIAGAGADSLDGSSGDDRLHGRLGDDVLTGGLGADRFNGGVGADTYVINFVGESTGAGYDRTLSFNTLDDAFDLPGAVTGLDAKVTTGALSKATFDTDLNAAIGATELGVSHAVIFSPDSGDFVGHRFLVIDNAGGAGYQAGVDYVILVDNMAHVAQLSTDNFI